ncbi:MAG: MFS transporter [Actinomycetota bacterium]|nr:MFS transporter [Actinomycetota bacterium]
MARVVTRVTGSAQEVGRWMQPRRDLVHERIVQQAASVEGTTPATAVFEAVHGPFRCYRRTARCEADADGGGTAVVSITDFRLAVPYFAWLVTLPTRRALRRLGEDDRQPWWAPPQRLGAREASVLGVLAAASVVTGYLGTLLTQTVTFAAEEFGAGGSRAQSVVLAAVRLGVLLALALVAAADRLGRRPVLLVCAAGGCLAAAAGAVAPTLAWLGASQLVARGFVTALAVLVTIVAAEEMPRGARAYAVSVLGMAGGLGAGLCLQALPLADLGLRGWRLVYLLALAGLPLVRSIARHLAESRRFVVAHATVALAGHGRRLALLAASAFLLAVFTAPASQLQNEFLRGERGFSASRIALFALLTNAPAGVGVVAGGRLADLRGRRVVGAVGLAGGVAATVAVYASTGWPQWAWSVVGAVVGGATLPALGVYGPELFPTSLRGRANGLVALLGVTGSVTGLLGAGVLAERLGGLGPALGLLALGPAVLVVLVLVAYPETAQRELEELNPEDRPSSGAAPEPTSPPPLPPGHRLP